MSSIINIVRRATRAIGGEEGQATVEYTLVGMCAAGMASLLLSWINKTSLVGKFFGTVAKNIIGLVG
ncbi:MAG: DUF4244 domain-containing protein [bacterium]|nr:DUF4244 domain-containing protein [bacterium]